MLEVVQYITPDGRCPFADWAARQDTLVKARIVAVIDRLARGSFSNVKWFSGIGEYPLDFGPGYRIYIAKDGLELVVLLAGGTKHLQQRDIGMAKTLHAEYKQRKAKLDQNLVIPI